MKSPLVTVAWSMGVLGLLAVAGLGGLVEPDLATAGVILLCFVCELMDSSLGMGYGTTITPVLLLAGYDPRQLVPTILVSEFLSGFAAFLFHAEAGNVTPARGSKHRRAVVVLSASSLIGVTIGVNVAMNLSRVALTRVIGLVIVAVGIVLLVVHARHFVFRTWKLGALGLVASFNKALSGGGYGPLLTGGQVLIGIESRAAVGITSLAEGFTCLGGAALFLWLGEGLEPGLLLPVVVGALLSVPVSAQAVRRISEERLRQLIGVLTLCLGILALLKTLF